MWVDGIQSGKVKSGQRYYFVPSRQSFQTVYLYSFILSWNVCTTSLQLKSASYMIYKTFDTKLSAHKIRLKLNTCHYTNQNSK